MLFLDIAREHLALLGHVDNPPALRFLEDR
jgi:hypothetical protein